MAYTGNENSAGLDTLTTLDSGDLIIVGDVSDSNRAKAITLTNLGASLPIPTGALLSANNLSDVSSVSTSRTSLGLGGAAVLNVGTSAGTVATGDDSRITGAVQKSSNLSDLTSASSARNNLGLGTLATQSGTFSGTSSGTNTGDQSVFKTISVSGQSDVVADSLTDTLTLAVANGLTVTTDAFTDTITISAPNPLIGGLVMEPVIGTKDGSNTTFTTGHTPVFITINGQVNVSGEGYASSGLTHIFTPAPQSTDILHCFYNAIIPNPALSGGGNYLGILGGLTY